MIDSDSTYDVQSETPTVHTGGYLFFKTDGSQKLSGARFALYTTEEDAKAQKNELKTAVSDENGEVAFMGLAYGSFSADEEGKSANGVENGKPLAVLNVSTFGSVRFPTVEKSKRIKRRFFHEQDKRTYPIYLEVNRLHLNAGFCLLPMSYIPLGETYSLTVLYGFAKDSLLESGSFDINRGDRLVLDTIFDTFTYIVTDIGTIEEGDTDYLKANKETNELLLLFFSPNQTKRFCVYAEPETSSNEKESSL